MALLDLTALECFLAVAETGSFTQAANQIAKTQSAVSQQVTKLENSFDRSFFNRGKKLSLTADGEMMISYARKIIQLSREAVDHFKEPELRGEVRFGLPEDFASVFLSKVLTEYASLHPNILLNIECDLTLNLFEKFKKKEYDLVLLKMNRPEDFPNGIDVWSEELVWVGRDQFFDLEDSKPLPLVLSPKPCVYRFRTIEALENANKKWRIVFTSGSYASKIAAVNAGMGITVLPRNMIPTHLSAINYSKKLPKLDNTHISLLKHDGNNPVINSFENYVIKHLQR